MSHLSSGSGRKNNVSNKSSADIRSNEIKKASEKLGGDIEAQRIKQEWASHKQAENTSER